ncbi:MAG: Cthe_2314 family HEPN domain-containing protein [Algoriphagus aquaeductus]|uniref:Cthe_2314 family HEPN domain-containing protein n=1 Tax=Algoriphagus aquaeductus TaxID=475299 RepID=UPI00387A448E
MSERKKIIEHYNDEISKIYDEFNLESLEDNSFKYKDINVLQLPINRIEEYPEFIPTIVLWDLINCLKDLKFFTANLILHRDYINNPLEELLHDEGRFITSIYHQNLFDRRYSIFVTCCFEKAYNYWDRIGDVIHSHFPYLLKVHQVDFSRIIDIMEKKDFNNENLNWLILFKNNQYKELNNFRKEFVHYNQFESKYRYKHNINSDNLDIIGTLFEEKLNFSDYFMEHLKVCMEGYYKLYKFIEGVKES